MHDEAQALILEGLERARQERLRSGRPRSDPLLAVLIGARACNLWIGRTQNGKCRSGGKGEQDGDANNPSFEFPAAVHCQGRSMVRLHGLIPLCESFAN
jgi:hypothetical protein